MVRAGLTTERLVRAGAELADEIGFDQVTPSELARRFDVKVASLYSHVKNAHDLRTKIALLALEELADRAAAALAGRAGRDALVAFADVYRDYAREHPGRYAAAQLRLDPETAAASAGVRHAQMMRAILRGYDLAGPDETHAVRLLGSFFHGFVALEAQGGFDHSSPAAPRELGPAPRRPRFPSPRLATILISTPMTADLVRGALELEPTERGGLRPHRLPARARAQNNDPRLAMAEAQPAGVRLRFRTRARVLELETLPTKLVYAGAPPRPDGVYDLLVDGKLTAQASITGGDTVTVDMATGASSHREGTTGVVRFADLPGHLKDVEIWLPHNEMTNAGRIAHGRAGRARAGPGTRLAAPRQLDQPRFERGEPVGDLARAGRCFRRRRPDQPGVQRQRPARPVHRPRVAGHPRRPDQRQARHQRRQRGPDAPARVRPGGARVPRHHPRGPSVGAAPGGVADPTARSTSGRPAPATSTTRRWPRARCGSGPPATPPRSRPGS